MFGFLKSLIGKAAILILLVLAAYGGWRWGPQVFPRVHEWLGLETAETAVEADPSPALADSVLDRIEAFRRGQGSDRMALGGRELTSLLRYSVPGWIPDGLSEPQVKLQDGRVHLRARVVLGAFPDLPDLGPILGLLPDTLDVALEGTLMPFGRETGALLVRQIEASRIPLPRRLIPDILKAVGRVDQEGLPPEAITFPLPSGLGSAYILTDSLILSNHP